MTLRPNTESTLQQTSTNTCFSRCASIQVSSTSLMLMASPPSILSFSPSKCTCFLSSGMVTMESVDARASPDPFSSLLFPTALRTEYGRLCQDSGSKAGGRVLLGGTLTILLPNLSTLHPASVCCLVSRSCIPPSFWSIALPSVTTSPSLSLPTCSSRITATSCLFLSTPSPPRGKKNDSSMAISATRCTCTAHASSTTFNCSSLMTW
eukprot:6468158-Amphidinium_carterae.1